jgi:hypothetical protein
VGCPIAQRWWPLKPVWEFPGATPPFPHSPAYQRVQEAVTNDRLSLSPESTAAAPTVIRDDRISTYTEDGRHRVIAEDLRELPYLREADSVLLGELAGAFTEVAFEPGEMLLSEGDRCQRLWGLVQGRAGPRSM